MPKAMLDKLPDKARDIYEAAWEQAKEDGRDDETAAKIAISAVKRAGYAKDDETGQWHKMRVLSMHITKAALGGDGVMRWAATTTKFGLDDQGDEMTPEFYRYAKAQVAAGKRPDPVLCISHIDRGKPDDSWVAGNVTDLYIDGTLPKAKGIFRDTPLGKAAFEAIRNDYGKPDDEKVRISLGFYDEGSEPIAVTKADGSELAGRRFLKGWIKHLALTRVPVVKETEIMAAMEVKAMPKTKQEDAASIVDAELAEELVREDKAELDEDLMLKQEQVEAEGETAQPIEKAVKTDDGKEFSASAYLVVPGKKKPSTWKLRIEEEPGKATVAQLGRAAAALGPGFRGQKVELPADERKAAAKKLIGKYRSMDVEDGDVPEYLWGMAGMKKPEKEKAAVTKQEPVDAESNGRRLQIIDLLDQLKNLLQEEWTVDTEIANAYALGNRGTNPPTTVERSEVTVDGHDGGTPAEPPEKEKSLATQVPTTPTPQAVEIAAYVDQWAMQVKAALLAEGDRREKFAALQGLINQFGENVVALVKGGTPPSSRDIADVVSEAIQAAVGPLQDQLAGVKAELDDFREKATMLGQGVPQAPRPQSLDSKARVVQPIGQTPGPRKKAWTAGELAWASTREGPGY